MATVVSYLLMAIAPHFFAQAVVGVAGNDGEVSNEANVLVEVIGEGDEKHVFVTSDGSALAGHNMVFAFAGSGLKDDGRSEKHKVEFRTVINHTGDDDRGWLGVSLVSVSGRDDGQTEAGVVITDVVDDSPADLAGLQADDVVVSIDGEAISTKINDLIKLVSTNKPGDEIDIVVLRDGVEKAFSVTLGSRAESKNIEWKFNTAPLAEIEENIHVRGKFLQRGDDGEWVFKDLGDLSEIEGLPANIKMLMPHTGSHMTKIFIGDEGQRVHTSTMRDGVGISVVQDDDEITVIRTDENGDKTIEIYADIEELQAADEEAAELLEGLGTQFEIKMDDLDLDDLHFDFKFDIDTENLTDSIGVWTQGMEGFGDAHEAFEEAHLKLEAVLQQIEDGGELSDNVLKSLPNMFKFEGMKGAPHIIHMSKAKQSFEVRPNGMIEVKIRKGDSELIDLYENEADLANRSPDLYKKYQDLRSEME